MPSAKKKKRFAYFLPTVLFLIFLIQIYVFKSFSDWLALLHISSQTGFWIRAALLLLIVYFNLALPIRIAERMVWHRDSRFTRYGLFVPGAIWTITSVLAFALWAARDVLIWIAQILIKNSPAETTTAALQVTGSVSAIAPVLWSGYGLLHTARDYDIRRVELSLPNLPSAFDGITVAHISDIHSGMYMKEREMQNVAELINGLHPQVAVLTGDFVDTKAREIEPVARIFSQLKTELGIYGCMGNHDLFDDYQAITESMRISGIQMLDNEAQTLQIGSDFLYIAGVGDRSRTYNLSNLPKALQNSDPGACKILLAHRPSHFENAQKHQIDLQLSGHTHGGQIALKLGSLRLTPVYLFEKYVQGLYSSGKSYLYVNGGVGMVFAPMRLAVPPEITLLTLRCSRSNAS